jgi:hypothetical protein
MGVPANLLNAGLRSNWSLLRALMKTSLWSGFARGQSSFASDQFDCSSVGINLSLRHALLMQTGTAP